MRTRFAVLAQDTSYRHSGCGKARVDLTWLLLPGSPNLVRNCPIRLLAEEEVQRLITCEPRFGDCCKMLR
jgi:hypothetical protein